MEGARGRGSGKNSASRPSPVTTKNYELSCDVVRTATAATLLCARLDTRSGRVELVALPKIASASGAAGEAHLPERYQLECMSTTIPNASDFRCVRMDRETGELALIEMDKLARIPE